MARARCLRSDGQCLRQKFASSSLSMPSASMIMLAARSLSSQLIACLRRLVMLYAPLFHRDCLLRAEPKSI
jgi:hypothetical protein